MTEKQGIVLATGGGSVKSRETRNRLSARGVVVYTETTIEKQLARTQRDKSVLCYKLMRRLAKFWKRWQMSAIHCTKRLLMSLSALTIKARKW